MKTRIAYVMLGVALWSLLVIPQVSSSAVVLTDRSDVLVHSASDSALGGEPSIAVHPTDWKTLLVSLITRGTIGCSGWTTTDAGITWVGDNEPAHSQGNGDPAAVIAHKVGGGFRYLIQSIASAASDTITIDGGGQRVVWRDSASSTNWPGQAFIQTTAVDKEIGTDKGFLHADNADGSSFQGWLYSVWYDTGGEGGGGAKFKHSENDGVTWRDLVTIKGSGETWGAAIATAIDATNLGDVYVAWPQATLGGSPGSILFRRSADGGASFGTEKTAVSSAAGYARNTDLGNHSESRANCNLSMVTDEQGRIYLSYNRPRVGGSDAHIYVVTSTNGGDTWSGSTAITSSTANQWHPSLAWDPDAKALVALYNDDRNDADSTEVMLAVSYDRGNSFTELKVSDRRGSGDRIVGDYFGIASAAGVAYPAWCDDRDGVSKAYVSPVYIGGVAADSITVSICPGALSNTLRFEATWRTRVASDGLDKLTVTPPGGSAMVRTVTNVTSAGHTVAVDSIAYVAGGNWSYIVESNKGPAVSRSGALTVLPQASVAHSNVQALVDSIQVTVSWTTSAQSSADVVKFYTDVTGGTEITPVVTNYSTSNGGLTHTAICKITPCVPQQYYYYTATSTLGCAVTSTRETSKRFKLTACVEP